MTRTTVTLDPDTEQMLRTRMKRRGVSFKRALNDSIREAHDRRAVTSAATTPRPMGAPVTDLTKALGVAASVEDDALLGELRRGR